MTGLVKRRQTTITAGGTEYPIETDFRAALTTWNAFEAAEDGELSYIAAVITAYKLMLNIDFDLEEHTANAQEIINALIEYFTVHSRVSDKEKPDNRAPLIDFNQDETLIRDAFLLLGKNLRDDDMDFPLFMSYFRLISTTNAPLCRIIYLRQLIRDGKIGHKEHRAERLEVRRIGEDIVLLRRMRSRRGQEEIDSRRAQNRERFKNVRAV